MGRAFAVVTVLPCNKTQQFSTFQPQLLGDLPGNMWIKFSTVMWGTEIFFLSFPSIFFFFHLLHTLTALKRHRGEPCNTVNVESCCRLGWISWNAKFPNIVILRSVQFVYMLTVFPDISVMIVDLHKRPTEVLSLETLSVTWQYEVTGAKENPGSCI